MDDVTFGQQQAKRKRRILSDSPVGSTDLTLWRIIASVAFVSVCLCLSVCHKSVFYQKGWPD